jgi:NAD(P)H-hydrate epimerase
VVDALLGTGINKAVNSPMSDVIRFLNGSGAEVISVDIPSGISSDTGQIMGEAVRSHVTVTFGLPKMGHFLHPGAEHTGRLFIEDIGFPADVTEADTLLSEVMDKRTVSLLMPERRAYSHKGDYGHVLIVAGSRGKTGAALMAAKACLRSGAGLVTVGVADSLVDSVQGRVTEEMVLPLPDTGVGIISAKAAGAIRDFLEQKANVLAMGPGLSADRDIEMLVLELLENISAPIVLDADAINVLEGRKERFLKGKAPIILTPHAGEMTRIARSGPSPSRKDAGVRLLRKELEENRVGMTRSFAGEHGVHIVLKGAPTIIAEPGGKVRINTSGNPGMATAGAGDVLTGMIAAFLGQGLNPFDASCSAVYLHGLAGDEAAREKGVHSLIASDIIEMIPQAFLSLTPHA